MAQSPFKQMNSISSMSDQGYMTLPFQIRFENALKESNIIVKCRALTDLIYESISINIKEMQHRFVLIIEDIFGCNNQFMNNWQLKTITKDFASNEFDVLYNFLCIDGPIFHLIHHLMNINDQALRYEFPISNLPSSFMANGFENGSYFLDKYSPSTSMLCLNAFEFYFIHFASFITRETFNMSPMINHCNNEESLKVLCYILLENYLEFFIPIVDINQLLKSPMFSNKNNKSFATNDSNLKSPSSIWNALSSTTTNLLNLSSLNNQQQQQQFNSQSFYDRNDSYTSNNRPSSILNPKMFNQFPNQQMQQQLQQNSIYDYHNELIGNITQKCDIVIRILSEIWLTNPFKIDNNQPQQHHDYSINNNISGNRSKRIVGGQFNITIEHMRCVRIFIKHLHYFCNSNSMMLDKNNRNNFILHQTSNYFADNHSNQHSLDDIKRSIWSTTSSLSSKYIIQKNLFTFFYIVFDRWPNDSSFRIPLETWLSYIQPWRYTSINRSANDNNNEILSTSINNIGDWQQFVDENLIFYTKLFQQVIERFIRTKLDLCSTNNSLLLYRILKIFGQNDLKEMLKIAELRFLNASTTVGYNNPNQTHQRSILFNQNHSPYRNAASNTTPTSFTSLNELFQMDYVSIFSTNFRNQIIELLMKIAKSLNYVNEILRDKSTKQQQQQTINDKSSIDNNTNNNSWLQSIINFFTCDPTDNQQSCYAQQSRTVNYDKIRNHLNMSIEYISKIFDIPEQSIQTILINSQKFSDDNNDNKSTLTTAAPTTDIYKINNDGVPMLTEYGLEQIMNGQIRLYDLYGQIRSKNNLLDENPDTQPTRSFEISILVRLTLLLSTLLNQKFGKIFETNYDRPNIYGKLMRLFLAKPVSYVRYEKQLIQNDQHDDQLKKAHQYKQMIKIIKLPPRINLRFMASYQFLIKIFLFTIFYWLAKCLSFTSIYLISTLIIVIISIILN